MSNIDEKAKNNFTIEMRIFENYEKVNHYWREEIGFGWRNLRCIIFSSMRYGIIGGF